MPLGKNLQNEGGRGQREPEPEHTRNGRIETEHRTCQRQCKASQRNLRGPHTRSHYYFEKKACDALGLRLVDISLSARNLVAPSVMLQLLDHFETIERPFVLHCKSGADRAGLASALYLIHIEGQSVAEARKQLSPRFLHFKFTSTGILDFLLDAYEKDSSDTGMNVRQWFETRYDPHALTQAFKASKQ